MDLQGEDSRVLADSADSLKRVKKLHIGTDSRDGEEKIYRFLSKLGWNLVRRYEPLKTTATNYGEICFVDGSMTWVNPKFTR